MSLLIAENAARLFLAVRLRRAVIVFSSTTRASLQHKTELDIVASSFASYLSRKIKSVTSAPCQPTEL